MKDSDKTSAMADIISAEIDRRKKLGDIEVDTASFIAGFSAAVANIAELARILINKK